MKTKDLRSVLFSAFILILVLAAASLVLTAASFQISNSLLRQQLDDLQRLKTANDDIKYFGQMETAEFRFKNEYRLDQIEAWEYADSRLRDLLRVQRLQAQTPTEINALRQIQTRLDDYGVVMREMFTLGQAERWDEIEYLEITTDSGETEVRDLSLETRALRNIMNDWIFDNYQPLLTILNNAMIAAQDFGTATRVLAIVVLVIFIMAALLIWRTIQTQYTDPLAQVEQVVTQLVSGDFEPAALDKLIQQGGDLGELAEAACRAGKSLTERRSTALAVMDDLRAQIT